MGRTRNLVLILVLGVAGLTGCATGKISVFTNPPEAKLYARPIGGGDLQFLGNTPMFLSASDLEKKFGGSGAVYFEIRKDGYKNDNMFVTEVSKIDLSIKRDLEPNRDRLAQEWLNRNVSKMFEIRRLVESKRLSEALSQIRQVKTELPLVSAVHELEGGILLLMGDYRSAVDAYRLSIKLNVDNTEAAKMVKYLERTYGFPKETEVADLPKQMEKLKEAMPDDKSRDPSSEVNRWEQR